MDLISFIQSLNYTAPTVEPEPEPEPEPEVMLPLVWGDSVVHYTGAQIHASQIAGTHNLYAPSHVWHNGKTYFCYQSIYQSGGKGQGYVQVYDERNGVMRPYLVGNIVGNNQHSGEGDSHTKPTFDVDKYGNLFMFQEETHDTPVGIYKGSDFNFFERLTETMGTEISYLHTFKDINGNGINWLRMVGLYFSYSGGHLAFNRATDGYEGWGAEVRVSTNPRPEKEYPPAGDPNDPSGYRTRHYPQVPYYNNEDETYYYFLGTQRVDGTLLGWWNIPCLFRTRKTGSDSFKVFENCFGTLYSHDISGDNYITETLMEDHFAYYNSGGYQYNIFSPVSTINDGYFFCVHGKALNAGTLVLIVGNLATREVVVKDLNISNYTSFSQSTQQVHAVKHVAYYEGILEIGIMIVNGSVNEMHMFRSGDLGDTFESLGNMAPEISGSVNTLSMPWNYYDIPNNRNFSICIMQNDGVTANSRALYVKRGAKGAIQTETPRIVIANSNYSDAHDLFDYQFGDGQITRSGNNITAVTDQFGIRNATGVNNPQWDTNKAITFNGTNNYLNIPTTGLTALTKFTLFAVFRTIGGAACTLLNFANNSLTNSFLSFMGADSNVSYVPSILFRKVSLTQVRDVGQTPTNDNNLHLITFVIDGRCKNDIYIDGKKQHYELFDTTDARLVDRGRMDFGTPNSIRIASRDSDTTDVFFAFTLQHMMAKHNVYSYDDQRAIEKQIADMHGITLNYGYNS